MSAVVPWLALAVYVLAPTVLPSFATVEVVPSRAVVVVARVTLPPPAVAAQVTVAPATGLALASVTSAASGVPRSAPATPV